MYREMHNKNAILHKGKENGAYVVQLFERLMSIISLPRQGKLCHL